MNKPSLLLKIAVVSSVFLAGGCISYQVKGLNRLLGRGAEPAEMDPTPGETNTELAVPATLGGTKSGLPLWNGKDPLKESDSIKPQSTSTPSPIMLMPGSKSMNLKGIMPGLESPPETTKPSPQL